MSTFPFGHMTGEPGPSDRTRSRGDIVIGSDVWIATNATVAVGRQDRSRRGGRRRLGGDRRRAALCGGVRQSRPRGVEAFCRRRSLPSFWSCAGGSSMIGRCGRCRPQLEEARTSVHSSRPAAAARGLTLRPAEPPPAMPATPATAGGLAAAKSSRSSRAVHPSFRSAELDRPLASLGIDSFTHAGDPSPHRAGDRRADRRPALDGGYHARAISSAPSLRRVPAMLTTSRSAAAIERRSYDLNMPQMALGGLSESWLFKELGDIHWRLITRRTRHRPHTRSPTPAASGCTRHSPASGSIPARACRLSGERAALSLRRRPPATARASISAK